MWWTFWSVMQPALAAPPGSYEVAREPVEFVAFGQGTINATIHFPAVAKNGQAVPDLSGAPYRGAAFLHGYLGSAWMYNEACDHLASMGMVVVNMDQVVREQQRRAGAVLARPKHGNIGTPIIKSTEKWTARRSATLR